jgi:hypothetical protein
MAKIYIEFTCDASYYDFHLNKRTLPIPGGKREFTLKPGLYYLSWRMAGAEGNTMSIKVKIDETSLPPLEAPIPRSRTSAGGVIKLKVAS